MPPLDRGDRRLRLDVRGGVTVGEAAADALVAGEVDGGQRASAARGAELVEVGRQAGVARRELLQAEELVDLVEPGRTLRENGLTVVDEITDSTGRLVVNRASYQLKAEAVARLVNALRAALNGGEAA
jgi:ATP phosphoribosyltransferase